MTWPIGLFFCLAASPVYTRRAVYAFQSFLLTHWLMASKNIFFATVQHLLYYCTFACFGLADSRRALLRDTEHNIHVQFFAYYAFVWNNLLAVDTLLCYHHTHLLTE